MERTESLELGVAVAILVAAHVVAPWVRERREGYAEQTRSLAGGMAAAYVFLHLLPELSASHELIGERIYFVVLAGFTVFYGLDAGMSGLLVRRAHSFSLRAVMALVYSALVGFTLGEQLPEGLAATSLYGLAIGLHFITLGNGLHEHFEQAYLRFRVSWLLALATLGGAALSLWTQGSERTIDLVTGVLAGFMLFNVMREEIPDTLRVRFIWFLCGIGLIFAPVLLLGS